MVKKNIFYMPHQKDFPYARRGGIHLVKKDETYHAYISVSEYDMGEGTDQDGTKFLIHGEKHGRLG